MVNKDILRVNDKVRKQFESSQAYKEYQTTIDY